MYPATCLLAASLALLAHALPQKYNGPPAQDKNTCFPTSNPEWVVSRDIAIQNARDYCSQNQTTMTYNEGTENELVLVISQWKHFGPDPTLVPDCFGRFQRAVIDGCGADAVKNPHNYKYGARLETADGYIFQMIPKHYHPEVPDPQCQWMKSKFGKDFC